MRAVRIDVLAEHLAHRYALPLKVFRDCIQALLTLTARGSNEENSADFTHFDLLNDERERLFRAGHNNLLHDVFEKLVDLVLFQVRLNRLHVVVFLHFVHRHSFMLLLFI